MQVLRADLTGTGAALGPIRIAELKKQSQVLRDLADARAVIIDFQRERIAALEHEVKRLKEKCGEDSQNDFD